MKKVYVVENVLVLKAIHSEPAKMKYEYHQLDRKRQEIKKVNEELESLTKAGDDGDLDQAESEAMSNAKMRGKTQANVQR